MGQGLGDALNQYGGAVAVDATGDAILSASVNGTIDFGGGPLMNAGGADVFLAKLGP